MWASTGDVLKVPEQSLPDGAMVCQPFEGPGGYADITDRGYDGVAIISRRSSSSHASLAHMCASIWT
jgi:hypothetical protein